MNNISPYVRFAMYDKISDPNWNISRVIFDYEIIYIDEGEMSIKVNKQNYVAKKGDVVFLKPNQTHLLTNNGTILNQPHVHFDIYEDNLSSKIKVSFKKQNEINTKEKEYFRNDSLKELGFNFPVVLKVPNSYVIKECLLQIIDEYNYELPDYKILLKSLLSQLLIELKRGYELSKNTYRENTSFKKDELRKFIYENIDQKITLNDMADFVHLSKFYFISEFKKMFNTTPMKYLNQIKADKAAKLILFTNLSINEIAEQLSFESQQIFSRWFKSIYKVSPLNYRKQQ